MSNKQRTSLTLNEALSSENETNQGLAVIFKSALEESFSQISERNGFDVIKTLRDRADQFENDEKCSHFLKMMDVQKFLKRNQADLDESDTIERKIQEKRELLISFTNNSFLENLLGNKRVQSKEVPKIKLLSRVNKLLAHGLFEELCFK